MIHAGDAPVRIGDRWTVDNARTRAALAAAFRTGVDAAQDGRWLVVITREFTPEVYNFTSERDARAFFDAASGQWTDSFLCRVSIGPGPRDPRELAKNDQ